MFERREKSKYGSVYRGMHIQTKKEVLIDLLHIGKMDEEDRDDADKRAARRRWVECEMELWYRTRSPHSIRLEDVFMNEWVRILVLEFPNEASLKYEITKRKKSIPEKEAMPEK